MDINRYHKLKNINFVWDQKDEQWHEMYNLVEKIFKDNSSSKDLIDDKLKHKISAWLYSQRIAKNKGKLSKDKIEKLNNLSIDWNPNKNSWLEKYYLLNEFVIKNKRIPKENEIVKDKKSLRNWFRHQLEPNQYDKLTDYQKNLIDNLKGYLKNDSLKMQWNTKLLLLEEYRFAKNEWPSKNITYKGVKIGQWLNTQKTAYKKGKLSKDRQGKLESIGFVFDKNKK